MICALFCVYGSFFLLPENLNLSFTQSLKYTDPVFIEHLHKTLN